MLQNPHGKAVQQFQKCEINLKAHDKAMKSATQAKYLGDILNEEGKIDFTIEERRQKGIGIVNQICSILSSVSLGFYYLDIALTLREARLVNGTLTNSEVWPSLNQKHLESLEEADLLRKIFKAHSKTASELFYLETGKIPFRFVIYKKCIYGKFFLEKKMNLSTRYIPSRNPKQPRVIGFKLLVN